MLKFAKPTLSSTSMFIKKNHRKVIDEIREFSLSLIIFSILLGIIVAVVTILFEQVIIRIPMLWSELGKLISVSDLSFWVTLAPIACAPVLWLCFFLTKANHQYGPADTIIAVNLRKQTIDVRSGFVSVLGAMISVGAGFPVGQYGPFVLLGSIIGEQFHKIPAIRPAYVHISIGSAVAGAIAVIFHAPIAGVVFAHEVLFRFFSVRAFAPITVTAVSAYVVSTKFFDHGAFFNLMPYHSEPSLADYQAILLSAIMAGFIAVLFINSIFWFQKKTGSITTFKRFILGAILVTAVSLAIPQVLLSGDNFAQKAIYSEYSHFLIIIFLAKITLTAICLGLGLPGGIFSPSMYLGMLLGVVFSQLLGSFIPLSEGEIIAVTTMASFTGAVMGAPITMILIIVEMTGDYNIISGVMLAVVVANIITYRVLGSASFYDKQLKLRGLDMDEGREKLYLINASIEKLISNDYLVVNANTTIKIAKETLIANDTQKAYVIDNNQYSGVLTMLSIERALRQVDDEEQILNNAIIGDTILYENTSMWHALEAMQKFEGSHMAVIKSKTDPTLIGVLYEHRLISEYIITVNKQRNLENAVTP